MSRHYKKDVIRKAGLIILSIGVGLILAVLVPFWSWILAAGAGLILGGWYLIDNWGHR